MQKKSQSNQRIFSFKGVLSLVVLVVFIMIAGATQIHAAPEVVNVGVSLSASPSPANANVTISVNTALSLAREDCNGAFFYNVNGTSVVPNEVAEIVSGQFAGQTIPLTKTSSGVLSICNSDGTVSPPAEQVTYAGSKQFSTADLPNGTYTSNVRVTDNEGLSTTRQVNFTVDHGNPPSVNLTASPTSVTSGGSSTLTWTTSGNPTSCSASGGWSGAKSVGGGSETITGITGDTTYRITCSNAVGSGSASASVTVTSGNPPSVTLTANPTTIASGGSSTLTWTTSGNPTSCTASGGWSGPKSVSGGSQSVSPVSDTTYTIECLNANGKSSDSATVKVNIETPKNPLGVHETASNSTCRISGWMNDPDTPNISPIGYVYSDGVEILSGSSGPCVSGKCPFDVDISGLITPNVTHSILVRAADTSTNQQFNLSSSPKDIRCSSGEPTSPSIGVDLKVRKVGSGTYQDSLSVASGSDIYLRWQTSGSPSSCTASGSWFGPKISSGDAELRTNITSNKTYTIECTKGTERVNDTVVVSVSNVSPPSVNLQVRESAADPWGEGPVTVTSGDSGDLRWIVSNATSCSASASEPDSLWKGAKSPTGGSQRLSNRTESKWYTISCSNAYGTRNDTERILVGQQTGTIVVRSIDVDTNTAVLTSWDLTGMGSSQTESNSSGETYANMPTSGNSTYTLVPGNDPTGYDLLDVRKTRNQTLTSGDTTTFTIRYQSEETPPENNGPLSCTPQDQAAVTGSLATVYASGGSGSYYWTTNADATPDEEQSGLFNAFTTRYANVGSKTVTVSDGSASVQCSIEVSEAPTAGCSNGIDDDGDGYRDYPDDLDCSGPNDSSEAGTASDYELDSGGLIIMGAGDTRSGATTITVRPQGGFSTSVAFSPTAVSGLPGGTSAFFSDGNGNPNEPADLAVRSSEYSTGVQFYIESAAPLSVGEYRLTVTGDAGGIVRREDILLRVLTVGSGGDGSGTATPIFEEF